MDRKQAEENRLKQAVVSASRKAEDGDRWGDIAQAVTIEREMYLRLLMIERRAGFAGDLAGYARTLVRVVADKQKPNSARLREYNDAALPSLEQSLFASDPVYKDMETV